MKLKTVVHDFFVLLVILFFVSSCSYSQNEKSTTEYFENFPQDASPIEIGNRVSENFLKRGHMLTPQDTTIHYSEVCTWYGAFTFAKLTNNIELRDDLVKRFEPLWSLPGSLVVPKREHVDWSVFGVVPLEIYMQTGDKKYFDFGIQRADKQWENPLENGLSPQTRYWIDDMYMISSLQAQAYRATKNIEYINRTARQMVAYLDTLQQSNGLFYHGFRGPFFWGRGNGWMAAGMTELLRELPQDNPHYDEIMNGYKKMMASLLKHQGEDGMWKQLVDYPEAWAETSSTGMFTFAFITGVKNGWLDAETYGHAARKAWLALIQYIDENANVKEVCMGMGQRQEAQGYLDARRADGDFHGQAPVLWCVSALLR